MILSAYNLLSELSQPREEYSDQRHETLNPNAPELQISKCNLLMEM